MLRPSADDLSIGNRTNALRWVPACKGVRRNVLGDYRSCRDNGVLAYGYSANNGYTGRDPDVFLNHDGVRDYAVASLRGCDRVAGRNEADVWPDHHIVGYVEPTKVIERAVLIDEYIAPDTDVDPAGCIEGGN